MYVFILINMWLYLWDLIFQRSITYTCEDVWLIWFSSFNSLISFKKSEKWKGCMQRGRQHTGGDHQVIKFRENTRCKSWGWLHERDLQNRASSRHFFCSDTLFANPITMYFTCNYAMFKCNQNLDMPGKKHSKVRVFFPFLSLKKLQDLSS